MYTISKERPLILYGSGISLEEYQTFINRWKLKFNIVGIIDNTLDKKMNDFPIELLDEDSLGGATLAVILNRDWVEPCESLESKGFTPFEDFIPSWVLTDYIEKDVIYYKLLKKLSQNDEESLSNFYHFISKERKIATIYGNCQANLIAQFLEKSKKFSDEYVIVQFPGIHEFDKGEKENGINKKILSAISLFIYMNVKTDNRFSPFLSTALICEKLNSDCIRTSIANPYFTGYFPQIGKGIVRGAFEERGTFYEDKLLSADSDFESILKTISNPDLYQQNFLLEKANESLEKLKEKDELCDIKISDFVIANYKKYKLFHTFSHAANIVLKELSKRILDYLGYRDVDLNSIETEENTALCLFIYPSVAKHLELEFSSHTTIFSGLETPEPVGLSEYAEYYIGNLNPIRFAKERLDCSATSSISPTFKINSMLVRLAENKKITVNNRRIHVNLLLKTIRKINKDVKIVSFPNVCSPLYNFSTVAYDETGKTYFIKICDGEIVSKTDILPEKIILIDLYYNIR